MEGDVKKLHSRDFSDKKPLHVACQEGLFEMVKYFVGDLKCSLNETDKERKTPLNYACEQGEKNIARYLVENGAIINDKLDDIGSYFCELASIGQVEKLKLFHESGANLMTGDYDNRTVAHIAAELNCVELLEFLVEETSYNILVKDIFGNTPDASSQSEGKLIIKRKYSLSEDRRESKKQAKRNNI